MIAPPLEIPVPFTVSASVSALVKENPLRSRTPPDEIVVPAAVVPRGPAVETADDTPSFIVPELMVVNPE